jgi:hypothetical protein
MTVTYLKVKSPHKVVQGIMIEQIWSGKKPIVKHLQVFSCDTYIHKPNQTRTKLDSKSTRCIFVGYDQNFKTYKLVNLQVDLQLRCGFQWRSKHCFTWKNFVLKRTRRSEIGWSETNHLSWVRHWSRCCS